MEKTDKSPGDPETMKRDDAPTTPRPSGALTGAVSALVDAAIERNTAQVMQCLSNHNSILLNEVIRLGTEIANVREAFLQSMRESREGMDQLTIKVDTLHRMVSESVVDELSALQTALAEERGVREREDDRIHCLIARSRVCTCDGANGKNRG